MKRRLRTILLTRIIAILLFTLGAIGLFLYSRGAREVAEISGRIIDSTSSLIDERISSLLVSAESQSGLLSRVIQPTLGGPPPTSGRARSWAPELVEFLRSNPSFSSVGYVVDRDGESARAVRQPNGGIVVQIVENRGGVRTSRDLTPFGEEFQESSPRQPDSYDARQSDWYAALRSSKEQTWSETYVIRTARMQGAPGVTCASPVLTSDGDFLGAVTVDFTLEDLSRYLKGIPVGKRGYAFLAERAPAQGVRVIAHPDPARLLKDSSGSQQLASLADLRDPLITTLLGQGAAGPLPSNPGEIVRRTVTVDGERWLSGAMKLKLDRAPDWMVFIVAPESDFTGGVTEAAVVLIAITVAVLTGAALGTFLLANRLTKPLQELALETARIRELQLEPSPAPQTNVLEISELAVSVENMKTGLRSFQKLVPADYARWLMRTGQEAKLGGERRHLTISFADLIGFTTLSESVPPEVLTEILSEYLDVLSGEVQKSEGTVDKFNGDDVMAFWGAPAHVEDHGVAACQTALSSQRTLARLYPDWEARGIPRLRVSFGIATGDVVVGNVGSRDRMNYTVIGDSVNLASRLQGLNRAYRTEILISEATVMEAGSLIVARLVDQVVLMGKEQAVPVYELCGLADSADPSWARVISLYTEGLTRLRNREWEEAESAFRSVLATRPTDGPSLVMLDRIGRFRVTPPPNDWDGAHRIDFK